MQNFINNWAQPLELAPGVTVLATGLPNGTYRLTFSDAVGLAATRWEIAEAVVVSGSATLTRGIEGTVDQAWPAGSVMYISVTAGFLEGLQQQIAAAGGAPKGIVELDVPDGGLAAQLPAGTGHVNCYLAAESPQPVRLIAPALPATVGAITGSLRVYSEGVSALTVEVPATPGIVYEYASAQYDSTALDVTLLDGAITVLPVGHVATEPWCVLFEFSIADFGGPYAVVAYISIVPANGGGGATSGWLPPAPV